MVSTFSLTVHNFHRSNRFLRYRVMLCGGGGGGGGGKEEKSQQLRSWASHSCFPSARHAFIFWEPRVYEVFVFSFQRIEHWRASSTQVQRVVFMLSLPPGVSSVWIDHRDACACVPCVRVGNRCCFVLCLQVHELILCLIHAVLLHALSLCVSFSQLLKRLYSRGEIGNEFHSSPEWGLCARWRHQRLVWEMQLSRAGRVRTEREGGGAGAQQCKPVAPDGMWTVVCIVRWAPYSYYLYRTRLIYLQL